MLKVDARPQLLRDVEDEALSEYMRASRAADLLEEIAMPLSVVGVPVASDRGVDAAWPDLERAVTLAVARLAADGSEDPA